jgi:hypothetical protein
MEIVGLSKKNLTGLLIAAALSSGTSYASPILLDFEGAGDRASLKNFYNNGTDASGKSGSNYNVHFSDDAVVSIDVDASPDKAYSGSFANVPSGITAIIFHEGGPATMNVESGFGTEFSLYYSSAADATVNIYDGMNGAGNLLASLNLTTNYDNGCKGSSDGNYCHWDQINESFSGIAHSVVFNGPREFTFYDNISFNSESISEVPVPGAFWLMGSGVISLLRARRK